MNTKSTPLFEAISVNMETGAISYPNLPGFKLDAEKVYSTARLFAAHCTPEMAVRHAIHGQLTAYQGACQLFGRARA